MSPYDECNNKGQQQRNQQRNVVDFNFRLIVGDGGLFLLSGIDAFIYVTKRVGICGPVEFSAGVSSDFPQRRNIQ